MKELLKWPKSEFQARSTYIIKGDNVMCLYQIESQMPIDEILNKYENLECLKMFERKFSWKQLEAKGKFHKVGYFNLICDEDCNDFIPSDLEITVHTLGKFTFMNQDPSKEYSLSNIIEVFCS